MDRSEVRNAQVSSGDKGKISGRTVVKLVKPRSLCLAMLLCLVALPCIVPAAGAETVGEIARVGEFGGALGQFTYPTDLAVDPAEDNSVFVLDEPGAEYAGVGPSSFRIQKFSSGLGMPVANLEIPTPAGGTGGRWVANIAVDPSLERLYVLIGTETELGQFNKYAGMQIDAYSTSDVVDGVLQPAPGVETKGKAGVFYEFPVMPTAKEFNKGAGTRPAAGTLREPEGMAVESMTHALILNGATEEGYAEIQRVAAEGSKFTSGQYVEAFEDTNEELTNGDSAATGVAAGSEEGVIYVVAPNLGAKGASNRFPGVAKLTTTGTFSLAKPQITIVKQVDSESVKLTGGTGAAFGSGPGAQIALSADGKTVYAGTVSMEGSSGTAGSYEARGMSTATGATQEVFGGGASTCLIASVRNAMAAGDKGVVYVLDDGNWVGSEPTTPTSFGFHLIEFGPGGSGCPSPATSIAVDGDKTKTTAKVEKGQLVELEASSAELNSEEPTKLTWTIEGPEKFSTEVPGKPASLSLKRRLLKPGIYTAKLEMLLSLESFGPVPEVTRSIEVTTPAPTAGFEASTTNPKSGEVVTFNASESLDPKGECTEASGCRATHKLKAYIWNFGDGSAEVTSATPEVTHAFLDSGGQYTVTLTVTNEEGVESTPTTQTVTVQGTPAITTTTTSHTTTTTTTQTSKTSVVTKKETARERLKHALRLCKKDKSKKQRAKCEAAAKKKYGPKTKAKRGSKKK